MSATRLVLRNHPTAGGASIIASTGTFDSLFPTSNLLLKDRYLPVATPGAGTNSVTLDLGSTVRTTQLVGYLAFKSASVFPTSVTVEASNSVPPTGLVGIATLAVSTGNPRDQGVWLASPVTYRYWKFSISSSFSPYSIGKFVIADAHDLGILYSPGALDSLVLQRVHNDSPGGIRMTTRTGLNRRAFRMSLERVNEDTRDEFLSVAGNAPFIIMHPFYGLCEVDLVDDRLPTEHFWGINDASYLFDVHLDVETLA